MDGSDNRRLQRLLLVVLAAAPLAAQAASGARQGVAPRPGEMVLLRDVSARPAYRPAPPGIALIADPSPRREVGQMLGLSELSDDDYAAMGSGSAAAGAPSGAGTTVERMTGPVVNGALGRIAGSDGMLSGAQLGHGIGGPVGAVGNATRGIGDHVLGALAQFPLGQGAGGPGN